MKTAAQQKEEAQAAEDRRAAEEGRKPARITLGLIRGEVRLFKEQTPCDGDADTDEGDR